MIDPALDKVSGKYFDGLASTKANSGAGARTACEGGNQIEVWHFTPTLEGINSGNIFFVYVERVSGTYSFG